MTLVAVNFVCTYNKRQSPVKIPCFRLLVTHNKRQGVLYYQFQRNTLGVQNFVDSTIQVFDTKIGESPA